jgi:hypothetical protein
VEFSEFRGGMVCHVHSPFLVELTKKTTEVIILQLI